jgi:N-acetylglutamate synthase-like GNAT family acetyltransferase
MIEFKLEFKEITLDDIDDLAKMYVETFNSPPWNDNWTLETSSKRLKQFINCEDFYGITAYQEDKLCGMILGSQEQFYDGIMFNIKEFCVKNDIRNNGIGTVILKEFEKLLKIKGVKEIVLFTSREDGTEGFYSKRGLKSYNSMVVMGKEL